MCKVTILIYFWSIVYTDLAGKNCCDMWENGLNLDNIFLIRSIECGRNIIYEHDLLCNN